MRFTKMHGAGNDYIYIDCMRQPLPKDPAVLARKISDRHWRQHTASAGPGPCRRISRSLMANIELNRKLLHASTSKSMSVVLLRQVGTPSDDLPYLVGCRRMVERHHRGLP
jgi:hypothetical protein